MSLFVFMGCYMQILMAQVVILLSLLNQTDNINVILHSRHLSSLIYYKKIST